MDDGAGQDGCGDNPEREAEQDAFCGRRPFAGSPMRPATKHATTKLRARTVTTTTAIDNPSRGVLSLATRAATGGRPYKNGAHDEREGRGSEDGEDHREQPISILEGTKRYGHTYSPVKY